MPANRPNRRSLAGGLLIALLLVGALIPAVSAELLTDSGESYITHEIPVYTGVDAYIDGIVFYRIEEYPTLTVVYAHPNIPTTSKTIVTNNPYYEMPVTFTMESGGAYVGSGTAYYNAIYTGETVSGVQIWVEVDEWDIGAATGSKVVKINPTSGLIFNGIKGYRGGDPCLGVDHPAGFRCVTTYFPTGSHIVRGSYEWQNEIDITSNQVEITRNIAGKPYASTVVINSDLGQISEDSTDDIGIYYLGSGNWTITNPFGNVYTGVFGDSTPEQSSGILNLYVQNSQTGALIAGPRAVVSAGFYDPADLIEVSNTTLAGGTKTYTLQPTGGGLPNPDYYRIFVTADGYNAELPYVDTELEAGLSITMILGMEPTAGAPEDENETYIEFYVRDINANPLSNAVVKCGGYTLMTNSAGFTQFDLPKNATYQYSVQKTGYTAMEGTVTVGAASRYPVNVVMGIGTVPTLTPGPTEPGATPTPDTRTNEQKGQEVIDLIADFALPIAILAILATLSGLLSMMMPRRR